MSSRNKRKVKKTEVSTSGKAVKQLTLSQFFSRNTFLNANKNEALNSKINCKITDICLSRNSKLRRTEQVKDEFPKNNGNENQLINTNVDFNSLNIISDNDFIDNSDTKPNSINLENSARKRDACSSSPELIPNSQERQDNWRLKKTKYIEESIFENVPKENTITQVKDNDEIFNEMYINGISKDFKSQNSSNLSQFQLCDIEEIENNLKLCLSTKNKNSKNFIPLKDSNSNDDFNCNSQKSASIIDQFMSSEFDNEEMDMTTVNHDTSEIFPINGVNLEKFKYCEVILCEAAVACKILHLKLRGCKTPFTCMLRGYWTYLSLDVGDKLSIKARFDNDSISWVVDDSYGFVVKHPDKLITGTSIATTCSCLRRAVLSNICPIYKPPESIMLIGSLIHELFQEVLKRNLRTLNDIQSVAANIEKSQQVLYSMYESEVSASFLKKELNEFTLHIYEFINMYLKPNISTNQNKEKTWNGEIVKVHGIEENFMLPSLGVKGKVDVTVIASSNGNQPKLMPLELKSGKVTYSAEHRGQLVLYMLMMAELGMPVDSGLLLYLRDNTVQEVSLNYRESCGLIMLRNELADYLVENEKIIDLSPEKAAFELPAPSRSYFNCSKCPHLTLCTASLSANDFNQATEKKDKLSTLIKSSISHLSHSHMQYFFHWVKLLRMESREFSKNSCAELSDIWHMNPEERKLRGSSVIVRVSNVAKSVEGSRVVHHMVNSKRDEESDFTNCSFSERDLIVVSTNSRYAITMGVVQHIAKSETILLLERDLTEIPDEEFYIDPYVTNNSIATNISNLRLLLENSDNADRLRIAVIDLELPTFGPSQKDIIQLGEKIIRDLNDAQQKAIFKSLFADHYALIKGMPGTGKTDTLSKLVEYLVLLNKSVLITSQTHSAVDNILIRLKGKVNFLRLGSHHRVHPDILDYCDDFALPKRNLESVEDVQRYYDEKNVIGVTCMNCIRNSVIQKRTFDYCIVDEATQVLQPTILAALYSAKKFILVGDPNQLPPIVMNKQASCLGLGESLFKKLDRPAVTSILNLQYRMNEEIMTLANLFAYNGLLQCANEDVKFQTIKMINPILNLEHKWLNLVLSDKLKHSVIFINAECPVKEMNGNQTVDYSNKHEGNIIFSIVNSLKQGGFEDSDIGVIASYRSQVSLLKQMAQKSQISIEISTVDQYQGRDKEIILFSCARIAKGKHGDILNDKRRLTVAITRAKKKLVIVGNMNALMSYSTFQELLSYIKTENIILVPFCDEDS